MAVHQSHGAGTYTHLAGAVEVDSRPSDVRSGDACVCCSYVVQGLDNGVVEAVASHLVVDDRRRPASGRVEDALVLGNTPAGARTPRSVIAIVDVGRRQARHSHVQIRVEEITGRAAGGVYLDLVLVPDDQVAGGEVNGRVGDGCCSHPDCGCSYSSTSRDVVEDRIDGASSTALVQDGLEAPRSAGRQVAVRCFVQPSRVHGGVRLRRRRAAARVCCR